MRTGRATRAAVSKSIVKSSMELLHRVGDEVVGVIGKG
jgi:hypothetical protein